ncbi:hypothetical protein ACFX2G_035329 [Malus domestica]
MNVSRLLAHIYRKIDAVLAKFWWANRNKEMGIHWVNWEEMGCAKGNGGIGFRNLMDFNTALLTKQFWRLIHEPDSLWARVRPKPKSCISSVKFEATKSAATFADLRTQDQEQDWKVFLTTRIRLGIRKISQA